MKKIIIIIMIAIMMGIIFLFSSYDAVSSAEQSKVVVGIINKYIPINSFYVRKLAHFSLFFLLELVLYIGIKMMVIKFPGLYSILILIIYAISDEVHQYFIPGRSCEIRDMFIDICGGLCALIIIKLWEVIIC
jgi:VanZ family protein